MQRIAEDIALLRCEDGMESTGTSCGQGEDVVESNDSQMKDTDEAQLDTAIFRYDSSMYRLMTFVKANRHLRVVDPTQSLHALIRAVSPQCQHPQLWGIGPDHAEWLTLHSFEHIFSDWDYSTASTSEGITQCTLQLSSALKFNVAVGLCKNGVVVRDMRSCCLGCALKAIPDACNGAPLRLIQSTAPKNLMIRIREPFVHSFV